VQGRFTEVERLNTIKEKDMISIPFIVIELDMMHPHAKSFRGRSNKIAKKKKVKH